MPVSLRPILIRFVTHLNSSYSISGQGSLLSVGKICNALSHLVVDEAAGNIVEGVVAIVVVIATPKTILDAIACTIENAQA